MGKRLGVNLTCVLEAHVGIVWLSDLFFLLS